MHIVVVGCGRVGSELANSLEARGHAVVIIDRNAQAFRRLGTFGGKRVVGQGFDRDLLESAGAGDAQAFAAVTSGDNSNILAARIAKESFQVPSVVARIYDPRRAEIYQRLGIATVATVAWTTDQVTRRLVGDQTIDWTDQAGKLHFLQRPLPASWAGKRVPDTGDVKVVAVSRAGAARALAAEFVGQEGDILHLLVPSERLEGLAGILARSEGTN
jgi:trk system potassium uptake protein